MNVDIITIWPKDHDYPPFRALLQRLEPYYNKAVIVFNGQAPKDYSPFIRQSVNPKKVACINARQHQGSEDWRNIAVHDALGASSSEWVWFLEPDFFFANTSVAEKVLSATNDFDCISFWEANRLHPACLLVKRSLIDKSRKDFGAYEKDHFGRFAEDMVAELGPDYIGELHKLGLNFEVDWYHMQGLTHNYNLVRNHDLGKIYKKDEFLTYNKYAREMYVPMCSDFTSEATQIEDLLGEFEENTVISSFMKALL